MGRRRRGYAGRRSFFPRAVTKFGRSGFSVQVHREVFSLLEDENKAVGAKGRIQVDHYKETFNDMRLVLTALIQNGNLNAVGASSAEAYKLANQQPATWSNISTGVLFFNSTTTTQAYLKFKRSMGFVTIMNPNAYDITFKMERYGWSKRFQGIDATYDLENYLKTELLSYFVTSVDTDTTGQANDVEYPQNFNLPPAGSFNGSGPAAWQGNTGMDRYMGRGLIKRLSSRKWRILKAGGSITYRITRPGIMYPIQQDFWFYYRQFDFLLRFLWKTSFLYIGKTAEDQIQIQRYDPNLGMKYSQVYQAEFGQFSTPGKIRVINRQPTRTRDAFPQPTAGNKVTQPQQGGGTIFIEGESALNPLP